LPGDSAAKYSTSISPDGKWLLYSREDGKTKYDLWVFPITTKDGKSEPHVFLRTPFNEFEGQFSPDGNWVAYSSDESSQFEVYVAPFPGPGGHRQISSGGAGWPRWSRDGKELFYVADDQLISIATTIRRGTLELGRVQRLFGGIILSANGSFAVSADSQKFLVVDNDAATSRPLTLLVNWTSELRK
jgi:Tol biopolymer transport system component